MDLDLKTGSFVCGYKSNEAGQQQQEGKCPFYYCSIVKVVIEKQRDIARCFYGSLVAHQEDHLCAMNRKSVISENYKGFRPANKKGLVALTSPVSYPGPYVFPRIVGFFFRSQE
jgi:hypothetical protein